MSDELEQAKKALETCRAELERGRDAQIQAETLAQLLGAAILRLKELGEKSWELPPHAKRLASHAEREGAEPFCWAVQNDQGYFVGAYTRKDSAEIVKNRGTHGETIVPLYSNPAPFAASGLDVPVKPDLEWLRKVAALVPNLDGTEDMTQVVRAIHGAILAVSPALRSRPAQGDAVYTKADIEAACELVRAANRKVEKIRLGKMVDRFLTWRLPEDFSPDTGISFKPNYNEHTAHPMKHEPIGTNLFTAEQTEKMLRHILEWDTPPDAAMSQQEKKDG